MLWFLNRFFGTFIGAGFGLVKAPYMMGIGIYNAIGSIALFLKSFSYQVLRSAKQFWDESAENVRGMLDAYANIFAILPNSFIGVRIIVGVLLALVGIPAFFVLKELSSLMEQVIELADTFFNFVYNVMKSLVTMAAVALTLPFLGMIVGLMHGIDEAYRQIIVGRKQPDNDDIIPPANNNNHNPDFNINPNNNVHHMHFRAVRFERRDSVDLNEIAQLLNPQLQVEADNFNADDAVAEIEAQFEDPDSVAAQEYLAQREAAIERAEERRRRLGPVDRSINGYIHRVVINNLPLNKAQEGTDRNGELGIAIDSLLPVMSHKKVKAEMEQLASTDPLKVRFNELNEEHSCAYTLDNLFDIEQPIVVEYQAGSDRHTKVFNSDDFMLMLNGKTDDFAFLPESRTPLTGRYRGWEEAEMDQRTVLQSVDHQVENGRLVPIPGSQMRIYKGLPFVVEQELEKVKMQAQMQCKENDKEKEKQAQTSVTNEEYSQLQRVPGGPQ